MSDPIESREETELGAETPMLSRRRALGLGAAVAGGVWAAPMILSFDAASATASGGGVPTTTTGSGPTTTAPASTTTAPATTTTTATPRTITASVTGSAYGVSNPTPVTVPVGEPVELIFTRTAPGTLYIYYSTANGTATAGVDYTSVPNFSYVVMGPSESTKTITIQTTATGAGPNTAFSLNVSNPD
jgi:hypothetical protein